MDELQAAFLRVKLRHLDAWNARRSTIAEQYLSQLSTLNSQLILPTVPSWADPVWHLFVIRHPRRDMLQQHLTEQAIQTIIHYPIPPHLSGAYTSFHEAPLPIAARLATEVLSLPIGPHMPASDITSVVEALSSFVAD
jgi:dTDP-4-amino-4,6-dideoxygalactose transaminase